MPDQPLDDLLRSAARERLDQAPADLLPALRGALASDTTRRHARAARDPWARRALPRVLAAAAVLGLAAVIIPIAGRLREEPPVPASVALGESLRTLPRSAKRLADLSTRPLREPISQLSARMSRGITQ